MNFWPSAHGCPRDLTRKGHTATARCPVAISLCLDRGPGLVPCVRTGTTTVHKIHVSHRYKKSLPTKQYIEMVMRSQPDCQCTNMQTAHTSIDLLHDICRKAETSNDKTSDAFAEEAITLASDKDILKLNDMFMHLAAQNTPEPNRLKDNSEKLPKTPLPPPKKFRKWCGKSLSVD